MAPGHQGVFWVGGGGTDATLEMKPRLGVGDETPLKGLGERGVARAGMARGV